MLKKETSPLRLFLALMAAIFAGAAIVVYGVKIFLPDTAPLWLVVLVCAAALTTILAIFVWRVFMQPLRMALIGEAARAKAIMDTAAEAIVTINENGIIETFNAAAELMFGHSARDAIGANIRILVPEPHASRHDDYLARYLRTGESRILGQTREIAALRADRTMFMVELTITEIRFAGKRQFTGIFRDITERKLAEQHIRHMAHHDGLTGLPNRVLFYDRLNQALSFARREQLEVALLYLDLDRFKAVNDELGHDAGDELLKHAAGRIRQQVRESDTVARIGGDEFTVILQRIALEDVRKVAEKIIDALSTAFDLGDGRRTVSIGTSIGIATYPVDAQDSDALVKAADAAMYDAKRVRNCFSFSRSADAEGQDRGTP